VSLSCQSSSPCKSLTFEGEHGLAASNSMRVNGRSEGQYQLVSPSHGSDVEIGTIGY